MRILKGPTGGLLASLALAAFLGGVALAAPGVTPTPSAEGERHAGVEAVRDPAGQGSATDVVVTGGGKAGFHGQVGHDVSSDVRSGVLPAPPANGRAQAASGGHGSTQHPTGEGQSPTPGSGGSQDPGSPGDGNGSNPSNDGNGGGTGNPGGGSSNAGGGTGNSGSGNAGGTNAGGNSGDSRGDAGDGGGASAGGKTGDGNTGGTGGDPGGTGGGTSGTGGNSGDSGKDHTDGDSHDRMHA
jgi:hypothetical protein